MAADLSSITGLITAAGSVIGLANKANSVEANQKILDLQGKLSEVQQAFAELFEENHQLREQNRMLQEQVKAEEFYPLRQGVRWKKSSDGEKDDGPFCPICFANRKVLMPLRVRGRMNAPGVISFLCPEEHKFPVSLGREPSYHIEEACLREGRYRMPD